MNILGLSFPENVPTDSKGEAWCQARTQRTSSFMD